MNVIHGICVIHRASEVNVIHNPLYVIQGTTGVLQSNLLRAPICQEPQFIKSPNLSRVPIVMSLVINNNFHVLDLVENTETLTSVKIHHEQLTKLIQFSY